MTREETIIFMMNKADEIYKNGWTWDAEMEIWQICSNWNSEHDENEEIFMCEHENEETGMIDGFYIEDDGWVFEDRDQSKKIKIKKRKREVKKMTREETIILMMNKADEIYKNGWTRDAEMEIWRIASNWNSDHDEDEEIFMCENEDEETGMINGFCIEDDSWVFEDIN